MSSPSSTRVPASASAVRFRSAPEGPSRREGRLRFPLWYSLPALDDVIDVVPFQEAHQPREMVRIGVREHYQVNRMLPVRQRCPSSRTRVAGFGPPSTSTVRRVGALDEYRLTLAYVEDGHP